MTAFTVRAENILDAARALRDRPSLAFDCCST